MRRHLTLLVVFLVMGADHVQGQSPAQLRQLGAWLDSVRAVPNLAQLVRLSPEGLDENDVVRQLHRAVFTLRRAELEHSQRDYAAAMFDFRQAATREPAWPWPLYGTSLALASLHSHRWPPLPFDGLLEGETYAEAATRALRESMERDPSFNDARRTGLMMLLAAGDRTLRGDAIAAVRAMLPTGDPDALLVWARHQRTERRYDSARVYLARAATNGGDPSVLGLELARTLRGLGDSAGARLAYWAGIAQLTSRGRALLRQDLGWLLGEDSLTVFDRLLPDSVAGWMHRFWDERDAIAAHRPGERLLDHLSRWVVAHGSFRALDPWRRTQFGRVKVVEPGVCVGDDSKFWDELSRLQPAMPGDIRDAERLLDYRGVALIRHGRPLVRLIAEPRGHNTTGGRSVGDDASRMVLGGLEIGDDPEGRESAVSLNRYETWLYHIEGRYRFLNFTSSEALGDFSTNTLGTYLPANATDYELLSKFDPAYRAAARAVQAGPPSQSACSVGKCVAIATPADCHPDVQQVILQARSDANLAIRTDSDSPRLLKPWLATVSFAAVGLDGTGSTSSLLIPFALARDRLVADSTPSSSTRYRINLRITAFETESGRSVTVDTTLALEASRSVADTGFVFGLLELPTSPGNWTVGILGTQQDPEAGFHSFQRGLRIEKRGSLRMSDLVLGLDRLRPRWQHAGGEVPVSPYRYWGSRSPLELYSELAGFRSGANIRATVEVIPTTPGRSGIKIESVMTASTEVLELRRSLDLRRLPEGPYRIRLSFETEGHRVSREQGLTLVK